MKLEGPDGLKSKIDFSEWNWGEIDLDEGLLKVVADRVAEVLWAEIVDSIGERYVRFSLANEDADGRPAIIVGLLDEHYLVISLSDITIDDDELDEGVPQLLRQWADDIEARRKKGP